MEIKLNHQGKEHSIAIDRPHYIRRLGMPKDHDLPEHVEEGMDWAVTWYHENGNPWMQFYELEVDLDNETLHLNGVLVEAPKVYKRFAKLAVKKAMLVVSTAGNKVDEETKALWSSDYPDRSFFLDTYAASVTEAIVAFAVSQLKDWASHKNVNTIARYSPGYPGWDLNGQILLMDIVNKVAKNEIPVSVSETALLNPLKSQLSLIGIYEGENKEKPLDIDCLQCTFMDCSCRMKGSFIRVED